MLQEIMPHVYHSEFARKKPADEDIMILQKGRNVLLSGTKAPGSENTWALPTIAQINVICPEAAESAYYLFSIDGQGYYSSATDVREREPFSWQSVMVLREAGQDYHAFGGAVGWQLANWYDLHRFCGRCGRETVHSEHERAILCPACGNVWYPRISPVVIIAITDGDRILLTRYNRSGYRRHALVAGFVEIGETLEDAVQREVMEEVGLRVKNIRYIESQPWPFSSSLIAGFQADVDGDPTVHLNTDGGEELAGAVWVEREALIIEDSNVSLTWDMIRRFKAGSL